MENWNRREGGEEKALEITSISLCSFTNIYRTKNMPIDSRKPTYFTIRYTYLSGATVYIHS